MATDEWKPLERASPLIEFAGCKNVRIEDLRIENASGWTLRPINCDGVLIRGIIIKNPVIGPNTDSIDPTGCQNVFIVDCLIDTGDDAICLKSENPYGDAVRVSKNITITNCVLTCCCNGLKFGTATRGGFENVTFSNSVIFNERVEEKAGVISGIAVEDLTLSNIRVDSEEGGPSERVTREIPELPKSYPEARMFGLPGTCQPCRAHSSTGAATRSRASSKFVLRLARGPVTVPISRSLA